jgi:hypothetical protein
MEVRALKVRHGLKALRPYMFFLILNLEKRDRQCCCSYEAVLAQGGEGDVSHHFNADVGLAVDDGPQPWLCGAKGYHHANFTHIQVVDPGQSATVDQSVPVVAKMDACVV